MSENEAYGTVWSDNDNDVVVAGYFDMLNKELRQEHFVKSHLNQNLAALIGRTPKSIEYKHQNISAILQSLGMPWVLGYKPLKNVQKSLLDAIERYLDSRPEPALVEPELVSGFADSSSLFIEQPPQISTGSDLTSEDLKRVVRKFDPAKRDAQNRRLGHSGEELALNAEISRLRTAGRNDLAKKVEWVSETNDAAGFDIRSFDLQGKERLLEVKTTRGYERTPFYLSENERRFSEERPDAFKLFRIYNFDREPKAFELIPPLEQFVRLQATNYRAHF